MKRETQIWTSREFQRFFILPADADLPEGNLILHAGLHELCVDASSMSPYEVTEEQALRWTKSELGASLTDLRTSLDETLADWRAQLDASRNTAVASDTSVTPNAVPALLDLLRALPRIVGQSISGDEARVENARATLTELQQKLANGGVDLDERFTGFADRLADLRRDFSAKTTESGPTSDAPVHEPEARLDEDTGDGASNPGPNR